MEEKKSIEILRKLKKIKTEVIPHPGCKTICELDKKEKEAIETVLNLLEKKDKIIDLMAEMLVKVPDNSSTSQTIIAILNSNLELHKIRVKQYFKKKVEEENK